MTLSFEDAAAAFAECCIANGKTPAAAVRELAEAWQEILKHECEFVKKQFAKMDE